MNYDALDIITDPILIIDDGKNLVFANKEAVNLFRLPAEHGMRSAASLLSGYKWLPESMYDQPLVKKLITSVEDDNSVLWHLTVAPALKDHACTDQRIITLHNIGRMKETFINRALDKWWEALASHLSSRVIYSHDMDMGSLQFAGDIKNLTGYSPEELTSLDHESFIDLIHPDDRSLAGSKIKTVINSASDICIEYRFRRKDGVYIYLSDTCAIVKDLGEKPLRFVGTIKEITKRRLEFESLSKGLNDARESERAKTRFLAMISHEMRTPLHSIRGIAGMLDHEVPDEKKGRMLKLLRSSCDILERLVEDASDIALIEEGRMRIRNETVTIPGLVHYITEVYAPQFAGKGIAFRISLDPGAPDHITADSSRIIQIFINLLDNALKFTLRGSVTVRIRTKGDGSMILFEFEDTGPGIEKGAIEEIFTPFNEAGLAGLNHAKGTGLGLAISKGLASLMGGDISVESSIGEGSRFMLSLPLKTAGIKAGGKLADGKELKALPLMKILAVDDIPENIELLKIYFQGSNVMLIEACNGKDAVSLFESENPDCVLLDMYLPDISGQAVARLIRMQEKESGGKDIPIIGITADCTKEHIMQALEAGCDICLLRPVEKADLFDHIAGFFPKPDETAQHDKAPDETADMKPKAIERIMKIASDIRVLCDSGDLEEIRKLGHAMMGLGMTFRLAQAEDSGRQIMEKVKIKDADSIRTLAEKTLCMDMQ